jgi:hypothetical protein
VSVSAWPGPLSLELRAVSLALAWWRLTLLRVQACRDRAAPTATGVGGSTLRRSGAVDVYDERVALSAEEHHMPSTVALFCHLHAAFAVVAGDMEAGIGDSCDLNASDAACSASADSSAVWLGPNPGSSVRPEPPEI